MHLTEILDLRHVVAAGVSIGITRRCPLHCAHCSTNSTMQSEEAPEWIFERFVGTFRPENRPEILALSGGEALLRPGLVQSLSERAHDVGTRTSVLSGLFFARSDQIPTPILNAINSVDHFSVSLDAFHEQEVTRAQVFRVLGQVLDRGKDVSLHLVGTGPDDPYLDGLINNVRARFGSAVPMLVNGLAHFGRGRALVPPRSQSDGGNTEEPATEASNAIAANPCAMAAWPVVGFDGTVAACGNDDVFDRRPDHLLLGHVATDDWQTIRERTSHSSLIRAIRLYGPEATAQRLGRSHRGCDGYCGTCMKLSEGRIPDPRLDMLMDRPATRVLEAEVHAMMEAGGAGAFLRRHAIARYADLANLGRPA